MIAPPLIGLIWKGWKGALVGWLLTTLGVFYFFREFIWLALLEILSRWSGYLPA